MLVVLYSYGSIYFLLHEHRYKHFYAESQGGIYSIYLEKEIAISS